ncbi:putative chaperone protein HSP31 OS=Saccharomyces cerevisiae (strain ATCC 204508 / S288c) GN=HSP31 PE=1 SV=1 [Rhizoctonia solani AG-1 IB]|uniref:D-lactate dehydratase n=1 Tax=Thanatephorus cucumeris (strain AG1-IB / isolate 7/3/14) TaxID=1108050 RepID=M5C6B4_THACB|nr:putative chaperone protein HSP31 [Rhizoctonia solani AG-1 IB]CEL56973.1 putative chaperone protein HSP31 OS=Saccharomyces cerevisiae (strain ATCC 204508 / S288c) GN=HSP31 PE=1 SV=1 [Rhizoctonia solani AG-1 IB]
MPSRILFVYSSADKTPSGAPTGWWLSEASHPYYLLHGKAEIDFASPKGPNPPVDEGSVKLSTDAESVKFLEDPEVKDKLADAKKLVDIDPKDYDAVFYIGGHGPMFDLASDPVSAELASAFFQSGKTTAAVCHGPGGLVGAKDASGKSIFAGRNVTGLSNIEEDAIGGTSLVPFLLEDRIKELGGKYTKATDPFGVKVVVDGNLITGQNPASALEVGEAILKALS